MSADFKKLKGQKFQFDKGGVRFGKIVGVNAGVRKGLKSLRVATQTYEGKTADGRDKWKWSRRFLLTAEEARSPRAGVMVRGMRGRIVPIDQFVSDQLPVASGRQHKPKTISGRARRPAQPRGRDKSSKGDSVPGARPPAVFNPPAPAQEAVDADAHFFGGLFA